MLNLSQFFIRIFVGYTTVLVISNLQSWNILVEAVNPTCTSPKCLSLGKLYANNMNKRANPCTDFYQYVCQNWAVNNQQIRNHNYWKIEELLQRNAYTTLQKILEDPIKNPVPKFEEAKAFYRACSKLPHIQTLNPNAVREIIRNVGHWPMMHHRNEKLPLGFNVWQIDNKYLQRAGESALFTVLLTKSNKMNGRIITQVSQLDSPYGKVYRTELWYGPSSQRRHYLAFLLKLTKILLQIATPLPSDIIKEVEDVVEFRDKLKILLHKLQKTKQREATIKEIQDSHNKYATSNSNRRIDWLEMIRHVYRNSKDSHGQPILPSTVIETDPNYTAELFKLLSKTPRRVIANHMHLYFAERHTVLSPDMITDLDLSYGYSNGRLNGFQRSLQTRGDLCITTHSMGKAIRIMYSRAVLPPEAKTEVQQLFHATKQLLKDEIIQSSWLDDNTKAMSTKKIAYITSDIGHPESYESATPVSNPFKADSLEPSAQFALESNRFYISASYLQPPMYFANAPYVIDYGATVALFGHELQHAFDTRALYLYENNTLSTWSGNMRLEYIKRANCFKEQYDKYRNNYVLKHKIDKQTVLPNTFDEDIADVTGLKIAYKGYKDMLKRKNNVCHVPPGFEKMHCDRVFFIAFANTFCASTTDPVEKCTLQFDGHSLPRIRVNGAVANMKEFSDAFGCKPGDPLNLKKRCDLWKN